MNPYSVRLPRRAVAARAARARRLQQATTRDAIHRLGEDLPRQGRLQGGDHPAQERDPGRAGQRRGAPAARARAARDAAMPVDAETEVRKAIDLKHRRTRRMPLLARALLAQGKFAPIVQEIDPPSSRPRRRARRPARRSRWRSAMLGNCQGRDALRSTRCCAEMPGRRTRARGQGADRRPGRRSRPRRCALVDRALAAAPDDREALVAKAQLYTARGDRDAAIRTLEQTGREASRMRAGARVALISLLVVVQAASTPRAAQLEKLKETRARTSSAPLYSDALLALARGEPQRGARRRPESARRAAPITCRALYLSGLIDLQLKSYAAAEEALRKVIAKAPNDPSARKVLATTSTCAAARRSRRSRRWSPRCAARPTIPSCCASPARRALASGTVAKRRRSTTSARLRSTRPTSAAGCGSRRCASRPARPSARSRTSRRSRKQDPPQHQADLALILAHIQRREYDKALAAVDALEKKQPDSQVAQQSARRGLHGEARFQGRARELREGAGGAAERRLGRVQPGGARRAGGQGRGRAQALREACSRRIRRTRSCCWRSPSSRR